MSDDLKIALIGVVAGIIGGLIQAWLSRRAERLRFMRDNKREAYANLMSSIAVLAFYPSASNEGKKAKASVAELRCRIALFGSSHVIKSLATVFERNLDLASPQAQADFAEAMRIIREDMGRGAESRLTDDLKRLVFSGSSKGT